jgi:hypothetical protein
MPAAFFRRRSRTPIKRRLLNAVAHVAELALLCVDSQQQALASGIIAHLVLDWCLNLAQIASCSISGLIEIYSGQQCS